MRTYPPLCAGACETLVMGYRAMKKIVYAGLALLAGCRTVPMTGRSQLMLSSETTENGLGVTSYSEYKKKFKVSKNAEYTDALRRCGNAIKKVAGCDNFEWEFTLLDSSTANAFCLPGGKVAFYSGIVDMMNNEAEMAFVMAHEIAHAIARHGGEAISWSRIKSLGGTLVAMGIQNDTVKEVYGMGAEIGVILPFSRRNESEADYIGLMLMAKAGYNPRAAPAFWKRFSSKNSSTTFIDNFMSTHPCDDVRIANMENNLEAALEEYRKVANKKDYGVKFRQEKSADSGSSTEDDSSTSL